jgi:ATP-dependent Clp protease ATP-binding subunit ClpA
MDPNVLWGIAIVLGIMGAIFLYQGRKEKGQGKQSTRPSAFSTDLIALAKKNKLDPFSDREQEIERTIHILLRRSKNNPLLIGEPGVGKTAIVHGLADRMAKGDVPESLKGKSLIAINLASLFGETKFRGELEKRVSEFLKDLEAQSRETILFIDEVHMIVQGNGSEGSLNVTDLFKPALARGDLHIIGATTWDEYAKYIKTDAALDRRFQPVLVDEPGPAQAVRMLKTLRPEYEAFHKVTIPDDVLKEAVRLSDKYIKGRFLPDKAIDLIDEAAAKVSIEYEDRQHGKHLGVVHGAAKQTKHPTVMKEDVEDVVNQWREHIEAQKIHNK